MVNGTVNLVSRGKMNSARKNDYVIDSVLPV